MGNTLENHLKLKLKILRKLVYNCSMCDSFIVQFQIDWNINKNVMGKQVLAMLEFKIDFWWNSHIVMAAGSPRVAWQLSTFNFWLNHGFHDMRGRV